MIGKVISILGKSAKSHKAGEYMHKFQKTIMSGGGKVTQSFEGKALQNLPEEFLSLTQALSRPKISMGIKSTQKGSGVMGVSVFDGNTPISKFAVGFDETMGKTPILQFRVRTYRNGVKNEGANFFINPNLHLDSKNYMAVNSVVKKSSSLNQTHILADQNGHLAQVRHYVGSGDGMLSGITKDKPDNVKSFNGIAKQLRAIYANKGKTTFNIRECQDEILQIIGRKGKPTVKSVNEAKDLIIKRMGYDPKIVTVKSDNLGMAAADFNPITGEIRIDSEILKKANNTDIAFLLSHEITHMDDFVKLYKSMGAEKFEKLVKPLFEEGAALNKAFYEKMSKYCDVSDFKHTSFIKEIKTKAKYSKANYTDDYSDFLYRHEYINSPLERNARSTENFIHSLGEGKLKTKAHPLHRYGEAPNVDLDSFYPSIQGKLEKYGTKKNDVFNEKYQEAFKMVDPELYGLRQNLKNGLPSEEFQLAQKQMEEIMKKRYITEENLEFRILNKLEQLLS